MKNIKLKKILVTVALLLVTALVAGICSGAAYEPSVMASEPGCSGCAIACAACTACTACTCLACLSGSTGASDVLSSMLEDAGSGYYTGSTTDQSWNTSDNGANVGDSISLS